MEGSLFSPQTIKKKKKLITTMYLTIVALFIFTELDHFFVFEISLVLTNAAFIW